MNEARSEQKILIVDDVPENIDALGTVLADYTRQVALNGKKALQKALSDNPPDLILLDIIMPDLDGYEVCRQLKANEKSRDIPVIFITAKDEIEDETQGFEVGAVDYITKPIIPAIVLARVKTHLELKCAREELKQQNAELIEAARLREDVERITRHDLKTPLNAIIAYPQLLLETGDNLRDDQIKYIQRIETSGLRMLTMINRSLDIFRMERGMYEFQPVPVDLAAVIKKVFADLQGPTMAEPSGCLLVMNRKPVVEGEKCLILGEELLCYAMLANLVKNALEAPPQGTPVTVELEERGRETSIRIHNAGVVPENIRARFFEKYVTAGKTTGTGLGTYSARLMAEIQHGRISMASSEETGTTVTIHLRTESR